METEEVRKESKGDELAQSSMIYTYEYDLTHLSLIYIIHMYTYIYKHADSPVKSTISLLL